jgi:hypothetical protein
MERRREERPGTINLTQARRDMNFRENGSDFAVPKIMPNVSNLQSRGAVNKNGNVGRSMPNIFRKLTAATNLIGEAGQPTSLTTRNQQYTSSSQNQQSNSSYAPNTGTITKGFRANNAQTRRPATNGNNSMYRVNVNSVNYGSGRNNGPAASQAPTDSQVLTNPLRGKGVGVSRKATFRVSRTVDGTHSEENLTRCTSQGSVNSNDGRSDEMAFDRNCGPLQSVTNIQSGYTLENEQSFYSNTSASAANSQHTTFINNTIKSNTVSQRNTKIPGPRERTARSGIPVSGVPQRTFLQANNRIQPTGITRHPEDSWSKGCV